MKSTVTINQDDNLLSLKVIKTNRHDIYIDKNINQVFKNAYKKHPKTFKSESYMYMYSKGNYDYFKNIITRNYEAVLKFCTKGFPKDGDYYE